MKPLDVLMPAKGMALIEDEISGRLPLHRLWLEPNPDLWLAEWAPRIRAVAMSGGHAHLDEAYLRQYPKLEIISSFGVGYDNIDAKAAARLGFPVLLKAAAGGGGRGMRVVHAPADLERSFGDATREAQAAFGDGSVYVERFLTRVRHVEIQVLSDGARVLHLGERDCSIQRRNQKLLEESPSPALDEGLRQAMGAAAAAFAETEHGLDRVAELYTAAIEQAAGGTAVQDAVAHEVARAAAEVGIAAGSPEAAELAQALRDTGLGSS